MAALRTMRVAYDDVHTYTALVDLEDRWNGWLCPRFELSEVRRLAKHTQADLAEGFEVDTIHVIDGYQHDVTNRTTVPATVVLQIHWTYFDGEGPKGATSVIEPDKDGLYHVGACEWCWTSAEDDETDETAASGSE